MKNRDARSRIRFIILVALLLVFTLPPLTWHLIPSVKAYSWWNTDFEYRRKHWINSSSGAGTGYQVKLYVYNVTGTTINDKLYCGVNCQDDFDDIRFVDDDDSTELDYWIEEISDTATNEATIWVELTGNLSADDQAFYVYYGNSSVSDESNGTETFPEIFDDFEDGSVDWTTRWQSDDESLYSEENGILVCDVTSNLSKAIWTQNDFEDVCVYSKVAVNQSNANIWMWSRDSVLYDNDDLCALHFNDPDDTWIRIGESADLDAEAYTSDWFYFQYFLPSSGTANVSILYDDLTMKHTDTGTPTYRPSNIHLVNNIQAHGRVDFFLARKWVSSEPAHNGWGSEENFDNTAPIYQNVGQRHSSIYNNQTNILYAQAKDTVGLHNAWLSTNESGAWANYTIGFAMNESEDSMTWMERSGVTPSTERFVVMSGVIVDYVYYLFYVNGSQDNIYLSKAPVPDADNINHGAFCWSDPVLVYQNSTYTADRMSICYSETDDVFYLLTGQWGVGGNSDFEIWNSTDGETWQYETQILCNDAPDAYEDQLNHITIKEHDGDYFMWCAARYININGKQSTLFFNSSLGFYNLTYQGIAIEYGDIPAFDGHASLLEAWYNETDSQWYAYIGADATLPTDWSWTYGGNSSDGLDWSYTSCLLNFTDWGAEGSGGWCDEGIYAPTGSVIPNTNTFVGVLSGYDDNVSESGHGHDFGYAIFDEPMNPSLSDFCIGYYGDGWRPSSPTDCGDVVDTWTWCNYTWGNTSVATLETTVVGWKICFNDTTGNVNCTSIQSFTVHRSFNVDDDYELFSGFPFFGSLLFSRELLQLSYENIQLRESSLDQKALGVLSGEELNLFSASIRDIELHRLLGSVFTFVSSSSRSLEFSRVLDGTVVLHGFSDASKELGHVLDGTVVLHGLSNTLKEASRVFGETVNVASWLTHLTEQLNLDESFVLVDNVQFFGAREGIKELSFTALYVFSFFNYGRVDNQELHRTLSGVVELHSRRFVVLEVVKLFFTHFESVFLEESVVVDLSEVAEVLTWQQQIVVGFSLVFPYILIAFAFALIGRRRRRRRSL